jgi:hypothetical protein
MESFSTAEYSAINKDLKRKNLTQTKSQENPEEFKPPPVPEYQPLDYFGKPIAKSLTTTKEKGLKTTQNIDETHAISVNDASTEIIAIKGVTSVRAMTTNKPTVAVKPNIPHYKDKCDTGADEKDDVYLLEQLVGQVNHEFTYQNQNRVSEHVYQDVDEPSTSGMDVTSTTV